MKNANNRIFVSSHYVSINGVDCESIEQLAYLLDNYPKDEIDEISRDLLALKNSGPQFLQDYIAELENTLLSSKYDN